MKTNAFFKIDGDTKTGLLLLADHARSTIPPQYHNLGLTPKQLNRHIAYDIGIESLTRYLANHLNAPALCSNFSRLLIDPNRSKIDPTLIMQISDGDIINGNYPLSDFERNTRIQHFYDPYDLAIGEMILDVETTSGKSPLVVSMHSFTPNWRGIARPWHVGLLWDADPRAVMPLFNALNEMGDIIVGNNQPYDGALKGDTMYRHCTKQGIAHVLIEVRQDLIANDDGAKAWANRLAPLIQAINHLPNIHQKTIYPSRCDALVNV